MFRTVDLGRFEVPTPPLPVPATIWSKRALPPFPSCWVIGAHHDRLNAIHDHPMENRLNATSGFECDGACFGGQDFSKHRRAIEHVCLQSRVMLH